MSLFFDTYFHELSQTFLDPRKRVFWGYLLCALLGAFIYFIWAKKASARAALNEIFSRKVWLSPSAKLDYQITLINKLLMQLLSPYLFTQLALATFLFYWFYEQFPHRPQALNEWSTLTISLLFTTCYFVLDDFARFYVHRLLHRWPLLWSFHKVHHSATRLTPFTVFRTHPVESIIFSLRSVATQGVAVGTFVFFLGDHAGLVTVIGANVFVFAFNVFGANLRHSHVPIRFWKPIEKIFISPAQHQIHHSIEARHWDKNFGVALSIWDRFFGSFHYSEDTPPKAFGLTDIKTQSLKSVYFRPFIETWVLLKEFGSFLVRSFFNKFRKSHRKTDYDRSEELV